MAVGYLAVLLCYLGLDQAARYRISSRLLGGNLELLVAVVKEFLQYHRQIDFEPPQSNGEVEVKASIVTRVQTVLETLEAG